MPCGKRIDSRNSARSLRRHADLVEVEAHHRSVEHSKHAAFAEHRRQRRDAKVDGVAADVQFDAAVLRNAALRDVEVRHDLDAARDRRRKVARRRHELVHHAVHPIPHLELVFERFEVDVRRLVANAEQQHHVEQLADGGGFRHFLDRFEVDRAGPVADRHQVFVGLNRLDDVFDRFRPTAVITADGGFDLLRLGDDAHDVVEREQVAKIVECADDWSDRPSPLSARGRSRPA